MSTTIHAGRLHGTLSWQVESCSFAADFHCSDRDRCCDSRCRGWPTAELGPWCPGLRVGGRVGDQITIDGLLNQLGLLGIAPEPASVEAAVGLRDKVTRTFGEVELVGLDGDDGGRLFLLLPDHRLVPLRSELDSADRRLGWGRVDHTAVETARLMIGRVWSRRWGPDEEMLAEALAHNFLGRCGESFSVTANSLCDWYVLDADLVTTLNAQDIDRIRLYAAPSS